MALSEQELREYQAVLSAFLERRRPPEPVRDQVDLDYRIEGQTVVIFEKRAAPRDPDKTIEIPIAKTSYVSTEGAWKVYWRRSDLKWHVYEPQAWVDSLADFVEVVDADAHGCFWG